MLASSILLALSPSLCWHDCPHCAGIAALVVMALLSLLHWCCYCLRCGLPCWRLSTCQLNKGKDACELTARQKHNKGKEACTIRALMPVYQGQQYQHDKGNLDDSKDECALMMATTPLLRGQWHQLGDNASSTTAKMPLQWGQQSPLQQQQRCLCINGNNVIATRSTTSSRWQQGRLRIDDDNNTIATRATMPSWERRQGHCNEGNNVGADQGQQCHQHVRLYYVHMNNSPTLLPRAMKPSTCRGCARNLHYQAMAISLLWPTPLSFPATKYLASQEFNRDIPLATTIQE